MRFSVLAPAPTVAAASAIAADASASGASGFWSTQGETVDALTALTVAGTDTADLDLGTAVIPIQGRHPMVMAQQALTANEHLGGRLILGLGVSHRPFIETTWGLSYHGAVAQMTEYLDVLLPLLEGDQVAYSGPHWTMNGGIKTAGPRPRVYLSALGPRMTELAGTRADGVITWFVGPRSLAEVSVPTMDLAAEQADRPRPELVSGFPICVTDDLASATELANTQYGGLAALPTYQRTLACEGVDRPSDIALVGSVSSVNDRLDELEALGVDNLMADVFGTPDERAATLALLSERSETVIDVREQAAAPLLHDAGDL